MLKKFFFDRNCVIDKSLSNHENIEQALVTDRINFSQILFVNQVHSAEIIVIDDAKKIHGKQNLPKVDGIVTNLSNLAIAVVTADCAPILLSDEKAKIIAAVHAGWRGAKLNIIKNAIDEMKKLGANIENIEADIGPLIHQKSYQVGDEFFADFVSENADFARFFISENKSYYFDLPSFVTYKLQQENVRKINNVNIDTYTNNDYASYRRGTHQGNKEYGRNVSLIVANA